MIRSAPPFPRSRRALLMAAAAAAGLALLMPGAVSPVAPAAHGGA